MNHLAKTLLAVALLLGPIAHAEYEHFEGTWRVKPGTTNDVTPAELLPMKLLAMNHASQTAAAGDEGAAIKEWATIGEANAGFEAEAVSILERARLHAARHEFETATELIDDLYARHSSFAAFGEAVKLQFEIANRLAAGERRKLGGWFPWFRDPEGAIALWQKTLRLADGFQKVSLKGDTHRGGLLGMAAVLTVSANGVETSPVTRGAWVSENILGVKPPPPPDTVPAIEPDVSGTTTIRERLAKHSTDRACAECHRKIDPLGFSLESFDPVGRWRITYPKPKKGAAPKIDTTGEFASGETYQDFAGFRDILHDKREEMFTRHLIRSLLAYSTGRLMEPADEFAVDRIHEKVKQQGLGLRSLVVECLTSDVFRSR